MQTITIDTRTKAGKIIFDLAKTLAQTNEGIVISKKALAKPAVAAKPKNVKQNLENLPENHPPKANAYLQNLKKVAFDIKNAPKDHKYQSLQNFLDDTYNPDFVAMVLKAKKSKNRTKIDPKDVWENI